MRASSRTALFGVLVIFGLVRAASGGAVERFSYYVDGKEIKMVHLAEKRMLLSLSCFAGGLEKPFCDGARALSRASYRKYPVRSAGGNDPGLLMCERLGGKALTAKDAGGDEDGICGFGDGSYVGSGSIRFYAGKNDE